jgi:hypothetical protein
MSENVFHDKAQELLSHWFRQVDEAREVIENRWTPGTMRTVVTHGEAMLRGYQALTEAMEASGEPEDRQAPSLNVLVLEAGGYPNITEEMWEQYDKSLAVWRQRMRAGDFAW